MDQTICALCGRNGQRGFVILSGAGDGSRDSYRCMNWSACERRQADADPVGALLRAVARQKGQA